MPIKCVLGRHSVVARGVRNQDHEFGRCHRCGCDLLRVGPAAWKRVPRGYKVVWRPRTGDELADRSAGQAVVGKTVDLRGVTVVGERTYGAQRFALVVLASDDDRSFVQSTDRIGQRGPVSAELQERLRLATQNNPWASLRPDAFPKKARLDDERPKRR